MRSVGKPHYVAQGLLVRDVRGDGSCGYRAVMFGMLEHDWNKTMGRLPHGVAAWAPATRPHDLTAFFDRHDAALCRTARDMVVRRIARDPEIREWAGDPRDSQTEAGRALAEARRPTGYMDEVALHALAKALDARIAIQFQNDVLVAPFKHPDDTRPVSVCLRPLDNAAPSDFVGHYMLCYPGRMREGNRISIDASMPRTVTQTV